MKVRYYKFLFFYLFFAVSVFAQNNLKVAAIFSDRMVLQRGVDIPVWGSAIPNEEVIISFKSEIFSAKAGEKGKWKITLPKQEVGEPLELTISTKKTAITFKDILVGEVWLASGQSNMHLDLKRTLNGEIVAAKANNPNIRIYNMKPTYPTGKDGVHTLFELDSIQNNLYFKTKGWVKVTPENVLYSSAVAYYFAEKLQGELQVPVGIIHNAVPGSPIESWLPKRVIQQDTEIKAFVDERWKDKKEEKDAMISVAKKQISLSKNPNQKHPWMPAYDYENGILPIKDFPVKGVIWYQGESNAENPELYKKMFAKMVRIWRTDWNENYPFYYVQLTSREDRAAWPAFRNAQRQLLEIVPNSKMVVITDVGDKQDTHAKNKRPVGERLAMLALGDSYQMGDNFESPVFDRIEYNNGKYKIFFKGKFNSFKTSDNKLVRGFEISDDGKKFYKVKAIIDGNMIIIDKLTERKIFAVRYAWKPFTDANVVSKTGFPLSTFLYSEKL